MYTPCLYGVHTIFASCEHDGNMMRQLHLTNRNIYHRVTPYYMIPHDSTWCYTVLPGVSYMRKCKLHNSLTYTHNMRLGSKF